MRRCVGHKNARHTHTQKELRASGSCGRFVSSNVCLRRVFVCAHVCVLALMGLFFLSLLLSLALQFCVCDEAIVWPVRQGRAAGRGHCWRE